MMPSNNESCFVTIDEFAKLDLRIGRIIQCQAVEGSDKLLQLTVNIGNETRNIFSGIKNAYAKPEELIGRFVVVIINLVPRKMRFGVSEGMILSASHPNGANHELFLLAVDEGAKVGMRVS
jgi:methionyl-tRNA synthetase